MIYLGLVATTLGGENGNSGDDRRWIQTTALIKRRCHAVAIRVPPISVCLVSRRSIRVARKIHSSEIYTYNTHCVFRKCQLIGGCQRRCLLCETKTRNK